MVAITLQLAIYAAVAYALISGIIDFYYYAGGGYLLYLLISCCTDSTRYIFN
jgi:hypothetical protein